MIIIMKTKLFKSFWSVEHSSNIEMRDGASNLKDGNDDVWVED